MAKQNPPIVGHAGAHPCKGSFYQERRLNIEKIGEGGHQVILRHLKCNCNTGCRRVALWHPRPADIETTDDWIVKAIARVRFGDDCGGPEVEVDWKHGVILDLMGCYDEVSFEIVELLGTAPDEDTHYTVGVLSTCCGAGTARGCATRTTEQISVGMGETTLIPIPPFAYAVSFAPDFGTTGNFFVSDTTIGQFGSGIGGIITIASGNDLPDPWMLVGGAETIAVVNGGSGAITFEVVYLIGV